MRFEIKTDQGRFSDKFSLVFGVSILTFFAVLITNISINISKLSRHSQINYLCKLILVDKSQSNFKKLAELTKQLKRHKIRDFCKEYSF